MSGDRASDDLLEGVVAEAGGGVYRVRLPEGGEVACSIRGRLKLEARSGDRVVVGDRVRIRRPLDGTGTVEEVLPRVQELLRRGPAGRKPRVVAANVDQALVVVAARDPEPHPEQVDRFLALAGVAGLPGVLVLNKTDLPGTQAVVETLSSFYGGIGIPVLAVSATDGAGLETLRERLRNRRSVFIGPSGVGKSSLLNALHPGLALRTGEVSRRRGTGRHTTVGAVLIDLPGGGEVVDTPGFSDAALWQVEPAELAAAFPEFRNRMEECRFRGCSHVHEPDCAIQGAVDSGEIHRSRYEAYLRLMAETGE